MDCLIYGLVDPRDKQLRYIGKTTKGLLRPRQHSSGRSLKEKNFKAYWIRQLISQGFKPDIVLIQEFEGPEVLNQAEIFWIAYFRSLNCPLTNSSNGGDGGATRTGKPKGIEERLKLSRSRLGKKDSLETRLKKAKASAGRRHSPEECARISARLKGNNFGHSNKGRVLTEQHKLRLSSKVIDNNGVVYNSVKEASQKIGVNISRVSLVLRGLAKTTRGLTFSYFKEN